MLHPFFLSQQLLCLVALCLIAGRAGMRPLPLLLAAFIAGMAVAAVAKATLPGLALFWRAPLVAAASSGAALAAFPRLPPWVAALLAACTGAAIAMDVAPEWPGVSGLAWTVAATAASAILLAGLAGPVLALAERRFGPVPPRVAGAWLLAISAMNLALTYRLA